RGTSAYEYRVATSNQLAVSRPHRRLRTAAPPTASMGNTTRQRTQNRLVHKGGELCPKRDPSQSRHARTGPTMPAALAKAPNTTITTRTARSGRLPNGPTPGRPALTLPPTERGE